jgi:hypothetical protein
VLTARVCGRPWGGKISTNVRGASPKTWRFSRQKQGFSDLWTDCSLSIKRRFLRAPVLCGVAVIPGHTCRV